MRRPNTLALLVGLTLAALLASNFLLFYFRDNLGTHFAFKTQTAAAFQAGQIPWWGAFEGGGQPFAGNPNTLTFYPDNVLYLLLPAHVAFNMHFWLHLLLGLAAMRALCLARGVSRRNANVAGAIYLMSGVAISAMAFYNLSTAVTLIPFALYSVERLLSAPNVRSALLAAAAFGLLALAGEPVTVLSVAIAAVLLSIGRVNRQTVSAAAVSLLLAAVIASPLLIAYGEISGEVERITHTFSTKAMLVAALDPLRIGEAFIGPYFGNLNDGQVSNFPGPLAALRERAVTDMPLRFFSTIFIGMIALAALAGRRRAWRYQLLAALTFFLSLGRFNPIVLAFVDALPALRIIRHPEKFAMMLTVALVVVIADWLDDPATKFHRAWPLLASIPVGFAAFDLSSRCSLAGFAALLVALLAMAAASIVALRRSPRQALLLLTFIPLAYWSIRLIPLDDIAPYRDALQTPFAAAMRGARVFHDPQLRFPGSRNWTTREVYHAHALALDGIFGAAVGARYAFDRSPDGMYSLYTRILTERIEAAPLELRWRYMRLLGCTRYITLTMIPNQRPALVQPISARAAAFAYGVPSPLPYILAAPALAGVDSLQQAVQLIESPQFDEHQQVIAPATLVSQAGSVATIAAARATPGHIELDATCGGNCVVLINETWFRAWTATANGQRLATVPLNVDRLGVILPRGRSHVVVEFGNRKRLVTAAWIVSSLLLLLALAMSLRKVPHSTFAPAEAT